MFCHQLFVLIFHNFRLQIHDKPVTPIRKSPRKSPCKQLLKITTEVTTGEENKINMLNQDWDDDTAESMDISSNIQDILNGLSEDELDEKVMETPELQVEEKENVLSNRLFPLFYKNKANSSQPA